MSKNTYIPKISKLLIICSNICYEQFDKAKTDPNYDGDIRILKSYKDNEDLFCDYEQISSFKAPEMEFTKDSDFVKETCKNVNINPESYEDLKVLAMNKTSVYFGFVLKSRSDKSNNIIAFRGTHTIEEWIEDFIAVQVPLPLGWFDKKFDFKMSKLHLGFLIQYAFLFEQVKEAASKLNKNLDLYITGHSLGAALAVLGALTVRILNYPIAGFKDNIHMYNYACPRVGNTAFSDIYNFLVKNSFRVVNMADLVPIVPPRYLKLGKIDMQYKHVGTEYSYLWQKGDFGENHDNVNNYMVAVNSEVPTNIPMKNAPVSGR